MAKRVACFAGAGALLPFSVWLLACTLNNLWTTPGVALLQFAVGMVAIDVMRDLLVIARHRDA